MAYYDSPCNGDYVYTAVPMDFDISAPGTYLIPGVDSISVDWNEECEEVFPEDGGIQDPKDGKIEDPGEEIPTEDSSQTSSGYSCRHTTQSAHLLMGFIFFLGFFIPFVLRRKNRK